MAGESIPPSDAPAAARPPAVSPSPTPFLSYRRIARASSIEFGMFAPIQTVHELIRSQADLDVEPPEQSPASSSPAPRATAPLAADTGSAAASANKEALAAEREGFAALTEFVGANVSDERAEAERGGKSSPAHEGSVATKLSICDIVEAQVRLSLLIPHS
jgi:hypothetical protein